MRFKTYPFLRLLLLLEIMSLCACTIDDGEAYPENEWVRLTATIAPLSGTSRAHVGDKGNESFQIEDRITLFITPQGESSSGALERSMSLAPGGWSPRLTWQDIKGRQIDFSAFYPEISVSGSGIFMHTVALDQRTDESFSKSDLLAASTRVERGNAVSLTFQHQLSLIELRLTSSSTFTAEQLSKAVVRIHACSSVQLQAVPTPKVLQHMEDRMENIVFHREEAGTYHVILPPQPIQEPWRKKWIEIELEGNTYIYGAPLELNGGEEFIALKSGQQLTLNLNLDREQITEDWANKTVWVYGLKDIPPVDTWNYATDDGLGHGFVGLKWNSLYGWYDCNKKNPQEGTGLDSNMCWAAACSNMIYWWLEQNAEYVRRYGYSGPSQYGNSIDSDVFELYRTHFNDTGNDVAGALSWFFTGRSLSGGKQSPAYFKELLGENEFVSTVIPIYTGRSLSDELKILFNSPKAIECTISTSRLIHAINIWGAEFDENGEVCALYITDNNDSDLYRQPEGFSFLDRKKTQAGLLYKPVKRISDKYYMEGSIKGNYSFYINELNTLDLMRDKWETFFKE